MADRAYVESLLQVFSSDERRSLQKAFEETLTFLRLGDVAATQSVNMAGTYITSTTSGTADEEVAIRHNLGEIPYMVMPVMSLASTGNQMVPLRVTRAADDQYLYLASPTTGAVITLYLEA